MSAVPISIHALCEIFKVSDPHLAKWEKEGVDIRDARAVVSKVWTLRKKPPLWVDTFTRMTKGDDPDTHEALKKEKTRAELERLTIANAKAKGDSFDRADGEAVMASWISALNISLTEMQSMLPPQLEGLAAAGIERLLGDEIQKIRENLSNLSSELWERVYEAYNPGYERASADEAGGGDREAGTKNERVKVVRKKRAPGSRSRPES